LYTVLLRDGLTVVPAGMVCLIFGLLLYLVALQVQGVSFTKLIRENALASDSKNR
jgi:hypothetical protein